MRKVPQAKDFRGALDPAYLPKPRRDDEEVKVALAMVVPAPAAPKEHDALGPHFAAEPKQEPAKGGGQRRRRRHQESTSFDPRRNLRDMRPS